MPSSCLTAYIIILSLIFSHCKFIFKCVSECLCVWFCVYDNQAYGWIL